MNIFDQNKHSTTRYFLKFIGPELMVLPVHLFSASCVENYVSHDNEFFRNDFLSHSGLSILVRNYCHSKSWPYSLSVGTCVVRNDKCEWCSKTENVMMLIGEMRSFLSSDMSPGPTRHGFKFSSPSRCVCFIQPGNVTYEAKTQVGLGETRTANRKVVF